MIQMQESPVARLSPIAPADSGIQNLHALLRARSAQFVFAGCMLCASLALNVGLIIALMGRG
ncbi:MAG TPA: hypothetical protein VGS41_14955 [Chthonomonadales bacterium]|nr:hypothetical protein [Chthonomonadales bacterium]